MGIEKLIEQLKYYGTTYAIGDNLGKEIDGSDELMLNAATALSTLQAENEKLGSELERMKKIMRENGIMVIPSKYPGGPAEWNIPKPRGQKED